MLVASTLASFAASGAMLAVSRLNYPGADALNRLHALAKNETGVVRVHMDTLACMTGVTRFLEIPPPPTVLGKEDEAALWMYDKEEDERRLLDPLFWKGIDYAIAEFPERLIGRYEVLDTVQGYAGVEIVRPTESLTLTNTIGWEDIRKICSHAAGKAKQKGNLDAVGECVEMAYEFVEGWMKRYVTGGWWVRMRMEPRLRVLRREREAVVFLDDGGEEGGFGIENGEVEGVEDQGGGDGDGDL